MMDGIGRIGYTASVLRSELAKHGETSIPETIAEEIRAGHCACEVKNPEGTCCLGSVREAVKRIRGGFYRRHRTLNLAERRIEIQRPDDV
jgi:hypothetical protein